MVTVDLTRGLLLDVAPHLDQTPPQHLQTAAFSRGRPKTPRQLHRPSLAACETPSDLEENQTGAAPKRSSAKRGERDKETEGERSHTRSKGKKM